MRKSEIGCRGRELRRASDCSRTGSGVSQWTRIKLRVEEAALAAWDQQPLPEDEDERQEHWRIGRVKAGESYATNAFLLGAYKNMDEAIATIAQMDEDEREQNEELDLIRRYFSMLLDKGFYWPTCNPGNRPPSPPSPPPPPPGMGGVAT